MYTPLLTVMLTEGGRQSGGGVRRVRAGLGSGRALHHRSKLPRLRARPAGESPNWTPSRTGSHALALAVRSDHVQRDEQNTGLNSGDYPRQV